MSRADMAALLPIMVLAAGAILTMLVVAFRRHYRLTVALTVACLLLSLAALVVSGGVVPHRFAMLLLIDRYALFYQGLLIGSALAVSLLAYDHFKRRRVYREELFILLLLATLGASVLVASNHFASFFVALELLTVALFALIGYRTDQESALEASAKYLILAGISSALLLFGMALIYAELGSLAFARIGETLVATEGLRNPYLLAGMGLIIVGLGFKLSLVPFHMWVPDIYQGASAPMAAYLATVSKIAVFALLLRYFAEAGGVHESLVPALSLIAIASMLAGNLLALLQNDIRRLLAYSSIAHMGYLMVAMMSVGLLGLEAASYYLSAYAVTMLGAFGVVSVLSGTEMEEGSGDIETYRGLGQRRPWLAGVLAVMMLSLAGIPLTMGFIAKFYVLATGVNSILWPPVAALVIGSTIGLFYYLRAILIMYGHQSNLPVEELRMGRSGTLVLAVLALLLVGLGVYPAPLIGLIQAAVAGLV